MKKITLGELIDSIEKNGYEQAYGTLFRDNYGGTETHKREDVGSACALGQGLLNFGFSGMRPAVNLPEHKRRVFGDFVNAVANYNDNEKLTPDKIATKVRKEFADHLNLLLEGYNWDEKTPFGGSIR